MARISLGRAFFYAAGYVVLVIVGNVSVIASSIYSGLSFQDPLSSVPVAVFSVFLLLVLNTTFIFKMLVDAAHIGSNSMKEEDISSDQEDSLEETDSELDPDEVDLLW